MTQFKLLLMPKQVLFYPLRTQHGMISRQHSKNTTKGKPKKRLWRRWVLLALGQEEKLWHAVRKEATIGSAQESSTRRKSFDPSSPIIDSLLKGNEQATSWETKSQILSIFANDFTRPELTNLIPSLTKWKIDQVRQHACDNDPYIEWLTYVWHDFRHHYKIWITRQPKELMLLIIWMTLLILSVTLDPVISLPN